MLSLYNDQCVEYNGVCVQYLPKLDNGTSLFTITLNGTSEDDIINLMSIITKFREFITEQCHDAVLPFLCQYIFPPCNVSSGNKNFISQSQCCNIRNVACPREWNLIMNTRSAPFQLPNCGHFDNNEDDDDNKIMPKQLQCHYQFTECSGLCLPLCRKFSPNRVDTKVRLRIITFFSGVSGFIGGILVFIATAYRWRAM